MIEAVACGKVNFGLRVGGAVDGGLHRVNGIFQSVAWTDRLTLAVAEEDSIASSSGAPVIDGEDNLAWRAVVAARNEAGNDAPLELTLDKSLPAAAGLGGGSADAAAALAMMGRLVGLEADSLLQLAARLGSDVPFCFTGGTAVVAGTGERLAALDDLDGFVMGLVVPPIELSTARVFARWDELGAPQGRPVTGAALPPPLRQHAPLVNDLEPAAESVAPLLGEWRAELRSVWDRPVLLTGSGPTLFAFFADAAEAEDALGTVPAGARASAVAAPVGFGWAAAVEDDVWTSKGRSPSVIATAERLLGR